MSKNKIIFLILLFFKKLYIYHIIQIFLGLSILSFSLHYQKEHLITYPKNKKYFIIIFVLEIFTYLIYFSIGFLSGFKPSPYKYNFLNIIKSIFLVGIPILSIEYLRSILLFKRNNPVFITIFLIIITFPYCSFPTLSNKEVIFKYFIETIIPLIITHITATFLSYKTSYYTSIIFLILERFAPLLFPILPKINWFISGSISIIKSLLIYITIKYYLLKEESYFIDKKKSSTLLPYAFVLGFATIFSSFMLGFLKYFPVAVLSNSMYPTYQRGDIIILKKLSKEEKETLKENTIIVYELDKQLIAHRIIKKINNNLYQTKGDNNKTADYKKVKVNQIKGTYLIRFKYLGYPSIWFHEILKR